MSAVLSSSLDSVPPAVPALAPAIREQFAQLRAQGLRARDAAERMQQPEGAVVAAHAGEHAYALKALALRGPWLELLQALQACGPLMALTRNASTVHEKTGVYQNVSATGPVGLALGPDIDLRLFFAQWHAGFAVTEPGRPGHPSAQSLQFFNAQGHAVHKIYVREQTDLAVWNAVVARFAEPSAGYVFQPAGPKPAVQADGDIDAPGLRQAWSDMQDTHEFFGLLRQFGAERQQSFRLVEGQFTQRLQAQAVPWLLERAARDALPIMVFVGSGGCIQIHTGPVHTIRPMDTADARWINVLDPDFNLHLRTDCIAAVWAVEKPTADGVVTSVEAFDHDGELMCMFFGERKPGQAELMGWRDLVAGLPRVDMPVLQP